MGRNSAPPHTIGLLTSTVEDNYENALLRGVTAGLSQSKTRLICLPSGGLHSYHEFGAQGNILHKLITPHTIDALILSGTLRHTASRQDLLQLIQQFQPLPMIGVALDDLDIPYLLVNSYQGIHQIVTHLITVHGHRQIAFIRGPIGQREAEDRFRAYQDALADHGHIFNPALVVQGDYSRPSGQDAMGSLLSRRVPFRAVVSANDTMALGAIEVLQANGYNLPEDVAITGFDDTEEGHYGSLTLTTVRQSAYEQGYEAAQLVLAQLAGKTIPVHTAARAMPVIRHSCGCKPGLPRIAHIDTAQLITEGEPLSAHRMVICQALVQTLAQFPEEMAEAWAETLFAALLDDIAEQTGAFPATLRAVLLQANLIEPDGNVWNRLLSVLYKLVRHWLSAELTREVWPTARQQIGEVMEQTQVQKRIVTERRAAMLRQMGDDLISSRDLADLLEIILQRVPELGVQAAYLALYEEPSLPMEWARLVLAFDENGRIPLQNSQRFWAPDLLPPELSPHKPGLSVVAEALYAKEQQLGFVLFVVKVQETAVCDALRGLISSSLQNILLHEKQKQTEHQLARRVDELETALQVSTATASTLNSIHLLQTVVDLTGEHFDLYHVQIALLDAAGQALQFVVGTGKVGEQFAADQFQIPFNQKKSLIARAARNRRGKIANNVNEDTGYLPHPLLTATRSEMAIPLIVGDELVGVLDLQSDEPNRFSQEDLRIHTILGAQIAVALENTRRYEQTHQMAEASEEEAHRQTLLNEMSTALGAATDLDGIFYVATSMVQQIVPSDRATVDLIDESGDISELYFRYGVDGEMISGTQYVLADTAVATALREARVINIPDLHQVEKPYARHMIVQGFQSALFAPLISHDGIIGALNLANRHPHAYDARDERLAYQMAALLAVTISNRKLFQRIASSLDRRRREVQTSTEIAQQIAAAPALAELFQRVVQLVQERFGYYHAQVYTVEKELSGTVMLRFQAGTGKIGQALYRVQHQLPLQAPQSLVAYAARTGEPQLVTDVSQSDTWLPNRLLPNTRSELAIPIMLGKQVLGVLDVQSERVGGLTAEDQLLLLGLCGQIAVAMDYRRAEREREALIVELEAKNAELERFTYTVSHDLKSPLVTIRGFLGLLERDALAGHQEQMKRDIEQIRSATTTMQHLLQDLLQLSRIGRLMNPPVTVPFAMLVDDALALVAGQITNRGVEVAVAPALPTVVVDRPRIVEVLQNLLDNAVKFMGNQPAPRIEIGTVSEREEIRGLFFVRDNGLGVERPYQEKIFGLFERLDPAVEGTGIGLALVKRIIEVHNGRIWLESDGSGKGSTFYFTLPLEEKKEP